MKTKEGIEVKVGQIWQDLDKRMGGRQVEVISVDEWCSGMEKVWKALVIPRPGFDGVSSRIRISRMHKHSTGWKLIREA